MRYSLIPIALLCACAADRSAAPVTMVSAKPPAVVADCILGQWLASDVPYPSLKAALGNGGYTVQLRADGIGPMLIADVMPDGSGSAVNYRPWTFGDWRLEGMTRSCL